jgi:formamidopyrimidine-DNA glycosylase
MPELPELDVLAENLATHLVGSRVKALRILSPAGLKTFDPPVEFLTDRTITGTGRRAKYVWLEVGPAPSRGDEPDRLFVVVHLSLGGRVSLGDKPASRKVGLVVVELEDGRMLSVLEGGTQRRAAVWVVRDPVEVPKLADLAIEPLDPGFTPEVLARILATGGHTLKGMLTDQKLMGGVGNAWSDETLHRAKLSPFAQPARLGPAEIERLHTALVGVLTEARGTMAEQMAGTVDIPKAAKRPFAVHGRAGSACFVCGDTIRSVWMGERETSYCPTCQTGGRTLADRRRSRFLR